MVQCRVVVRLYSSEQLVELILANSYEVLIENVDVFEAVLADVLKDKDVADVYITRIVSINDT